MASIPKKVAERLSAGVKRFQPILAAARARDVGEADTVTVIKREVMEGDKAEDASRKINRAVSRAMKAKAKPATSAEATTSLAPTPSPEESTVIAPA